MPVIDWVRTDLLYKTDEGSIALKYDHRDMCIFENFILELPGAYDRYSSQIIDQSKKKFKRMNQKQIQTLMYALMGGLAAPRNVAGFSIFGRFLLASIALFFWQLRAT